MAPSDWIPLAAIALLFSYFSVSIAYMLSKAFHLPKLEAWARFEYRETVISAILLAGLFFAVGMIDIVNAQFLSSAYPDQPSCLYPPSGTMPIFKSGCNYLVASSDNMLEIYRELTRADRYVAKISSFYYNIAIPLYLASASYSKSPRGGLTVLSTMISAGLDAMSMAIFLQTAQKVLLRFFEENAGWLLWLGLTLRTFSATRRLGSTMFAIAIAVFVVYPLTMVFASQVYSQFIAASSIPDPFIIPLPAEPPDPQDSLICNPFVQTFTRLGSIFWWFIWFTPPCSAATVGYWACMLANYPTAQSLYSGIDAVFLLASAPQLLRYANPSLDIGDIYQPVAEFALPAVAQNAMLAAVLAVFSIVLTVSSARALSTELGGDAQFYGIYKLI